MAPATDRRTEECSWRRPRWRTWDRFIRVFSTKGADKRRLHGSKGATVFADPSEADRVWAIFDWDAAGWKNFVSDPEVPAILQEAGQVGKPQAAMLLGCFEA